MLLTAAKKTPFLIKQSSIAIMSSLVNYIKIDNFLQSSGENEVLGLSVDRFLGSLRSLAVLLGRNVHKSSGEAATTSAASPLF